MLQLHKRLLYQAGLSVYRKSSNILNVFNGVITELMPASPATTELANNDFAAKTAIIATASALLNSDIETRKQAVETAQIFQAINQTYQDYIDIQMSSITDIEDVIVQDADIYSLVQNTAGALYEMSSSLKVEQTIELEELSNIIQLAYEYYPEDFAADPDNTVDYLISTNNFSDDDFLFLEKGKKVLIYV